MSAVPYARSLRDTAGFEWLPVIAGLLILYVPTFYDLARTLWQRDDFAHGPIILAIIAWLFWDRRQMLLAPPTGTAPASGLSLLVIGLLSYVVGRSQGIMVLEAGSLAPVLGSVLIAMRGWQAIRVFWFAILFIAYLVPLPGFFVDAMTLPLKQNVSEIAARALYAAGYPVAQDGVMLIVGQYRLLVADACSGLNSMFSLSAVGLLYLYLMQRKNWLHNVLILASLLPTAFLANIARVIILVLVTYHFGDSAGQGFVHGFSGLLMFMIALIIIIVLDTILAMIIKPRQGAR